MYMKGCLLCLIVVSNCGVNSGRMLEVWENYIALEILLGNVKEARALYKRCFNRRLDGMGTEV
jgi:hypothetical protein